MLTSVGRFLRKLRIDEGEILRDMAKKLGVSSAFLSAVENGKKKVPEVWITKLEELYSLTPVQVTELKDAIIESSDTIELNIRNASSANRQLAVSFARQFDTLDEETTKKLFSIFYDPVSYGPSGYVYPEETFEILLLSVQRKAVNVFLIHHPGYS